MLEQGWKLSLQEGSFPGAGLATTGLQEYYLKNQQVLPSEVSYLIGLSGWAI